MEASTCVHNTRKVLNRFQIHLHRVGTAPQVHLLQVVRRCSDIERIAEVLFPELLCELHFHFIISQDYVLG